MARTAGSWVAVVGTRSSNRSRASPVLREGAPRVDHPSSAPSLPRLGHRARRSVPVPPGSSGIARRRLANPRPVTPDGFVPKRVGPPRSPRLRQARLPGLWGWYWLAGDERRLPAVVPLTAGPAGDAGAAVLVAAMESAPAAIYCLTAARRAGLGQRPGAGARHRRGTTSRASTGARSPTSSTTSSARGGRRPSAARWAPTGRRRHGASCGRCGWPGAPALWWSWSPTSATDTSLWPSPRPTSSSRRSCRCCRRPCRCCPTSAVGQLPPGVVARRPPAATGTTRCRSAPGGSPSWSVTPSGHGVPAAGAMSRLRGAMRSTALRDPVARGRCSPPSTPSPRRWTTSRAPRSSTACWTPAPATSPTPRPGTRRRWSSHADGRHVVPAGAPRGRRWAACRTRRPTMSEHVLEQGATLVLFSNGAVAGSAPDAGRGAATGWPTSPATVLAGTRRAGRRGVGRARPRRSPRACARPEGWPDDVAVLVAHRRDDRAGAAAAGAGRRPRGAARGPPSARRLARPGSGWGSRTASGSWSPSARPARTPPSTPTAAAEPGPMSVTAARRRRRGAHRRRPRRGHLAAAGPRPRRPRPRAADHAAARRRASCSRRRRGGRRSR